MKLSQEQVNKLKTQPSAGPSRFSKLADYKVPDSPPPEKEPEDDDPNGPNKFDQLMKAACSIKTAQLEQQRKKFELLPTFLKSGVYYTQKHEVVRIQDDFRVKMMVFELIKNDANSEFAQQHYDRACRKYEEALGCFRFYEATDPSWQDKGIDDDRLREVDYKGDTPEQQQAILDIKISTFLNIAACNIKVKAFTEATAACEEVLKLDATNIRAFYRRARATALPINAGVPDLRKAIQDLDRVLELAKEGKFEFVKKEKVRVQALISINYKREQETYAKMFNPKTSVSEFVKRTSKGMDALKFKTIEEKEFEAELDKIDQEVSLMLQEKMKEFSFEVKAGWETSHFPEVDDVQVIVEKTIESYRIFKKAGKFKEANMMKDKIKETKYAKEHLKLVMSLDFTQPTPKMIDMAEKNNIDLKDPKVIEEFKKIQSQNLRDIHLMKEGKRPPTQEELQDQMREEREAEFKRKMDEYENKNKETQDKFEKFVKAQNELHEETRDKLENELQKQTFRDQIFIGVIVVLWFVLIFYANYLELFTGGGQPDSATLNGHKLAGQDGGL